MATGNCTEYIANNNEDCTAPSAPVVALSFRITDMGNGVDRIEYAKRVPFDDVCAGASLPDSEPLPRPVPPRILHATTHVLGALGIKAPAHPELLIEGYSRLASSHSIDVVAWLSLLV